METLPATYQGLRGLPRPRPCTASWLQYKQDDRYFLQHLRLSDAHAPLPCRALARLRGSCSSYGPPGAESVLGLLTGWKMPSTANFTDREVRWD
jgi:hypothetical protein